MIHNSPIRVGNITSSNCWKLFATPQKVNTYIQELKYERMLQRSLGAEADAKPLKWGKLLEKFVFQKIGIRYKITSQESLMHPDIMGWSGSPDGFKKDCVMEIKCPYTLKSYCELKDIIESGSIDVFKKEKPEYYWQIVSNSILLKMDRGELIVYCPYQEDLAAIRHEAQNVDAQDLYKYYWLGSATDEELPYLIKESGLKDLMQWEFEIPNEDKELLTEKIKQTLEKL